MNDGFTEVKSKRNRKGKKSICRSTVDFECFETDSAAVKRKVIELKKKLEESFFLTSIFSVISDHCSSIEEILCYGLGSFSNSYISRTQLAALLAIKEHYQAKVWVYDPLFQPAEKSLLSSFGIEIITCNEEGKRIVSPSSNTFVFFPHCPKQLVNNFLWANWNPSLEKCIILSNSFSSIIEKNTKTTLNSLSCLRDIVHIAREFEVSEIDEFCYVFNDLSIHVFNSSHNKDFWAAREEPIYSEDIEFISKEVSVKLRVI